MVQVQVLKEIYNHRVVEKKWQDQKNSEYPRDLILDYGTDTLKFYLTFVKNADLEDYDDYVLDGIYRFLSRVWRVVMDSLEPKSEMTNNEGALLEVKTALHDMIRRYQKTSKKGDHHLAAASLMECSVKFAEQMEVGYQIPKEVLSDYLICLAAFAPAISQELWHRLGHMDSVLLQELPMLQEEDCMDDLVDLPVCINAKKLTNIRMGRNLEEQEAVKIVQEKLNEKWPCAIQKIVYIPGKMMNIVL